MPHASLKIRPGLDQNETPALNEAGFSSSNLIRFIYDRVQGALVQKLGGWTKFYPNQMPAVVRALWAWEDTNSKSHLAVGTENITTSAQLSVITNGSQEVITPQYKIQDEPPVFSTTSGSSIVTITDASTTGVTNYDSVYIQTHVSVGGLILFGFYQTYELSSITYQIISRDVIGNPLAATSTSTSAAVASFSVTLDSNIVTVTLNNHGFSVGDTYPILVSTTVGGIVLYGNYTVSVVTNANTFKINANTYATSTTTGSINGGDVRYVYSFGVGALGVGAGYGEGYYGQYGYGGTNVPPASFDPIPADDWTLDNWGQVLVACPVNDTIYQPIYTWDPTSGGSIANVIPEAPTVNDGIFVAMPQRQIIAWGSTFSGIQDRLLIRWCDVNNYNDWYATVTNQAGSYRIPKGSKIVGCIQGPQQGLVWTDLGLWAMQYIGQPYVYSFNEIGTGCGLIGRKAAASVNGIVYWMGASQFFMLGGSGVEPVACPIWDVIFQDLDTSSANKIRVAVNSRFGEITWYYPTLSSGGEVNAYAKYNTYLKCWDFGILGRSAWIDQSVLGPPIGADPTSNYIYQHETSTDADGQPMNSSFQTGYFALSEADLKNFIDQVWPDMKFGYYGGTQNATVNLTFYVTDYPGDTPLTYGPFQITKNTQFVTPRFRGRLVSIGISSNDIGSFWRIGNIRYRFQPDGKF